MNLDVRAFSEHLSLGREDLISPAEVEAFALSPGLSTCFGHGCSSTSCCCCASMSEGLEEQLANAQVAGAEAPAQVVCTSA